jgi:hypothetical protein
MESKMLFLQRGGREEGNGPNFGVILAEIFLKRVGKTLIKKISKLFAAIRSECA